ncbi:MAG: hypothetical protein R2873_15405 [Caldilineaceae bacterium]
MQLLLAARTPPLKVSRSVPLSCDPVPQTSFAGSPVAINPVSAASRSSVKVRPVACALGWLLVMVNESTTVLPAGTGSSRILC